MPTISQQPADVQWITALASGTTYPNYGAALAAAVVLSAANANAAVQIASVDQVATAPTAGTLANVKMPSGTTYVIQLANAGTTNPLSTALTTAYATSASNSNAPVNIARVIEQVTAP